VRLFLVCAAAVVTLIAVDVAAAPDVYTLPPRIAGLRTPLALGGGLAFVGLLWLGVGAVLARRRGTPPSC
jgi:hypothetical protein